MKGVIFFLVGVAVSSVSLSNLVTMADDRRAVQVVAKQEIVIGHRIGSLGQEILVTK
ncbi:hypothetical protein MZD04_gp128 [Pseudomonas phage Psa21]|uniref:Uncharacterized protein n=1 Tax=Pseudomonas phage Psa21 TaxID=2530023 RepID=A0A481W4I4_9CAUD|nr:hypothetical protein MZD04_gp128 [Pseudomonas phage Psa21]QBJ02656.1 hypothetical protein PSA21_128 [Pseudomonas phage Psa21]